MNLGLVFPLYESLISRRPMIGELCLVSMMFCYLINFIHDLVETLAGHRASQLMEALSCALMYGYADMENEPLKVSSGD